MSAEIHTTTGEHVLRVLTDVCGRRSGRRRRVSQLRATFAAATWTSPSTMARCGAGRGRSSCGTQTWPSGSIAEIRAEARADIMHQTRTSAGAAVVRSIQRRTGLFRGRGWWVLGLDEWHGLDAALRARDAQMAQEDEQRVIAAAAAAAPRGGALFSGQPLLPQLLPPPPLQQRQSLRPSKRSPAAASWGSLSTSRSLRPRSRRPR